MKPHICEASATANGWYRVGLPIMGYWLHIHPHEIGIERPAYFIGTARELCLMFGLETGDTSL
jgi:hypothetical protein